MHYLIPVFATLEPKKDDVIQMSAMVEDYATALNRKDVLHVRLKGITGDDNLKVAPPPPHLWVILQHKRMSLELA